MSAADRRRAAGGAGRAAGRGPGPGAARRGPATTSPPVARRSSACIVALGVRSSARSTSRRSSCRRRRAIVAALEENWSRAASRSGRRRRRRSSRRSAGSSSGPWRASLVAFATARWPSARDVLLPLAIAAGAIPIIAFAPLMNNWFGVLNPLSKMMMAAVLVFFPVMANVTRGLSRWSRRALELMRSYAATRRRDPAQGPRPQRAAVLLHGAQARRPR